MNVLELSVSPTGTPGRYLAHITHSPAGEASALLTIEPESLVRRDELQRSVLASATATRAITRTVEQPIRQVGEDLFSAIFSSAPLAGRYRASLAVSEERGERLRIVLRIDAPELAALPWEAMYDAESGRYICRREPLVRALSAPTAARPLELRPPLRVLGIAASPRGLPMLDVDKEKHSMAVALEHLSDAGSVSLEWVHSATWDGVQEALLSGEWHVIHFVGHGDYDVDQGEGVLALAGDDGRVNRVEAGRFVDLLSEASPTPRLVVLNACSSATAGADDLFSGTASALSRSGINAVVAMQFAVSDTAAIDFCRGFYSALAHGRGVDDALRSGRIAILGRNAGTLEWLTPVLYLRGSDAKIFTFLEPSRGTPLEPSRGTPPEPSPGTPPEPSADAQPARPAARPADQRATPPAAQPATPPAAPPATPPAAPPAGPRPERRSRPLPEPAADQPQPPAGTQPEAQPEAQPAPPTARDDRPAKVSKADKKPKAPREPGREPSWRARVVFENRGAGSLLTDSLLRLRLDRDHVVVARSQMKDNLEVDGVVKASSWVTVRGSYAFELEDGDATRDVTFDVGMALSPFDPWAGIYRFSNLTIDGLPVDIHEAERPAS